MGISEGYKITERHMTSFMRGVKEIHNIPEIMAEASGGMQKAGRTTTMIVYGTASLYFFVNYGLKGLLILALPAITNISSYIRRYQREQRIREIGEP